MACSEETMRYNNVTEVLYNTFGAVLPRETIYTIVESCCGDLNHAANAIMSITSDESTEVFPALPPVENSTHSSIPVNNGRTTKKGHSRNKNNMSNTTAKMTSMPKVSYASVSTSKKKENTPKQNETRNNVNAWSEQIKQIVTYHNKGYKTLILMRGAPGSGKTYLARQIQEMTVGATPEHGHIFSTDDYFMSNGYYRYEIKKLQDAHVWNQWRASEALSKGVSPVIIDNTNIEIWEMHPYARNAVHNGYYVEVVEPNTKWAKNLYQLSSRNSHGVPPSTIKRMLEMLTSPISSACLITNLKLVYPRGMQPPMLRKIPKLSPSRDTTKKENTMSTFQERKSNQDATVNDKDNKHNQAGHIIETKAEICQSMISTNNEHFENTVEEEGFNNVSENIEKLELNRDENITDNLGNAAHKSNRKGIVSDLAEITKKEDQDKIINSNVISKEEPKDEITPEKNKLDVKVEENVCQELENISESKYKEDKASKKNHVNISNWLEQYQTVVNEWDNGEAWEEDTGTAKQESSVSTKPTTGIGLPRDKRSKENKNFLQNIDTENDWRKMYTPMSSITDDNNLSSIEPNNLVETKSTETCIEVGDTDTYNLKNVSKILSSVPRDINTDYLPNLPEKIPEKRKLDKSSMTNENTIMSGAHRCRNEDKHFIRFRNMFKYLKKDDLRDVFDNCCGDVNWAVSIVLDDTENTQFECIAPGEQSPEEEDLDEPCDCTSFYGIIPDVAPTDVKEENILDVSSNATAVNTESLNSTKKQKKDCSVSDVSMALKRQLEQNIVIADQHYSEQCLKVRKMRRDETHGDASTSQNIATGITMQNTNSQLHSDDLGISIIESSSIDAKSQDVQEKGPTENDEAESNSDDESVFNEVEKTVNINLGHEFLKELDAYFGRSDMGYSENVEPKINIPISLLNVINALWIESFMSQLEDETKPHEDLIKQDEDVAKALALEQVEIASLGKEQEVPSLKEIMDMEFALSLYRKDCLELMEKDRPKDIATKLSVKKLQDLFPEIPQADLDEIFMAHSYDFRTTVRVLLETQGRVDIVQEKNGIDKFITAKELERQEKYMAAERERLLGEAWPELSKKIDMDTVKSYRTKAKLHLVSWNKNYGKAKQLVKKNAAIANYYNKLAGLHFIKYERARNFADASMVHVHTNSTMYGTLDLHYLRVAEAIATLDMIIDSYIQCNRMARDKPSTTTLLVITGRGLHSPNGPKIKPAVEIRLAQRGLEFRRMNPGLVSIELDASTPMSYEID